MFVYMLGGGVHARNIQCPTEHARRRTQAAAPSEPLATYRQGLCATVGTVCRYALDHCTNEASACASICYRRFLPLRLAASCSGGATCARARAGHIAHRRCQQAAVLVGEMGSDNRKKLKILLQQYFSASIFMVGDLRTCT